MAEIEHAQLTKRFNPKVKTIHSLLTGGEIIATVLAPHAAHIPTHAQLVTRCFEPKLKTCTLEANKAVGAVPKTIPVPPRQDSTGELRRLYSIGKCKFGSTRKRVRDDETIDPSPNTRDFPTLNLVYPNGVNMYINRMTKERNERRRSFYLTRRSGENHISEDA